MSYDIGIWEQIRSIVQWKTASLEQDIIREISVDRSLRDFHDIYPVPWQCKEVLKHRAATWIQRLYNPCCDAYKNSGGELSHEFEGAVWAFWIEPFIMREVQTTADGYRASKLMELLLCSVGSTPDKRRYLKVGQKDSCLAVRNEMYDAWRSKLLHIPSQLDEAVRALSRYREMEVRAQRIARGLPPEPVPTAPIPTPGSSVTVPERSPAADAPPPQSNDSKSAASLSAPEQPAPSPPTVKSRDSTAKNWQSIELLFLSEHRVQVCRNGKRSETLNFAEFGFEDTRSGKPSRAWEILVKLAQERGCIRDGRTVGEPWPKVEKRIQEIRKVLRDYFALPDDPIPFVEGTGYQAVFKIRCSPSFSA